MIALRSGPPSPDGDRAGRVKGLIEGTMSGIECGRMWLFYWYIQ